MTGGWTLTVRADGNPAVGYGHLVRSLAVAKALRRITDINVRFLMPEDADAGPVGAAGFDVERIVRRDRWWMQCDPGDAPLLLDSYTVGQDELMQLHNAGFAVAMFDDGCRLGRYHAQLVVDSSPAALSLPYRGLPGTVLLLGPAYFPLREEIRNVAPRDSQPEQAGNLLLTFGGSDPGDAAASVLEAVKLEGNWQNVTVITGPGYRGKLPEGKQSGGRVEVIRDPPDYAARVRDADLAICSAGQTAWELAWLGVPMLLLTLSPDQRPNAESLENARAAVRLGELADFDPVRLRQALEETRDDRALREMLARNARKLIDGDGALRIAQEIALMWAKRNNG